jgi:hypothetical protein
MIAAHGRGWMKARATALARVLGLEPPSGTCRYDLPRYRVQSPRATPRRGSERAAPRHLAVENSRWCRHASVERRTCPPRRRASHPFRYPATRQVGFGVAPAFVEQCRHVPPGDTRRFTHRGAGHRSGSTHRHLPGVLADVADAGGAGARGLAQARLKGIDSRDAVAQTTRDAGWDFVHQGPVSRDG